MEELKYERNIDFLISTAKLNDMLKADELVRELNNLPLIKQQEQVDILRSLFGSVGENPSISHGFHCDFGCNIHIGDNFYVGYNCTMLDYAEITIGNNCLFGPNVGLYTTYHNLYPEDRCKTGKARPIKIGDDVWIGGNCCILAGVTIGEGAVIGAGSVVNCDVKPYTLVAGNPDRLIKSIK